MTIKMDKVTKQIGNVTVINSFTYHFKEGHIYGLSGQNGAGKTMLMRLVCGLIRPSCGTITIDGKVLGKEISFPNSIGILIENPSFVPDYSGIKNLKAIASIQNNITEDEIRNALSLVGLNPDEKKHFENTR